MTPERIMKRLEEFSKGYTLPSQEELNAAFSLEQLESLKVFAQAILKERDEERDSLIQQQDMRIEALELKCNRLHTAFEASEKAKSHLSAKNAELKGYQASIESEREANSKLTEQIEELERMVALLKELSAEAHDMSLDDKHIVCRSILLRGIDAAQQTALDYENRIKAEALREAQNICVSIIANRKKEGRLGYNAIMDCIDEIGIKAEKLEGKS